MSERHPRSLFLLSALSLYSHTVTKKLYVTAYLRHWNISKVQESSFLAPDMYRQGYLWSNREWLCGTS